MTGRTLLELLTVAAVGILIMLIVDHALGPDPHACAMVAYSMPIAGSCP